MSTLFQRKCASLCLGSFNAHTPPIAICLLNGKFPEASWDSVNLRHGEPETFDLLIQWMHRERLAPEDLRRLLVVPNPVR